MGTVSCPQCGIVNDDGLSACYQCGSPLQRPTRAPWKVGLYVLSAFLIVLGILFIWASPVASTVPRLIVGVIMIALGVILILLLRRGGVRQQRYYSEEAEDEGSTNVMQLTCKVCGATLGKDSLSLVNGVSKLICPQCQQPYHVEEEPRW